MEGVQPSRCVATRRRRQRAASMMAVVVVSLLLMGACIPGAAAYPRQPFVISPDAQLQQQQQQHQYAAAAAAVQVQHCNGEWALVMCGDLPANDTAALGACCAAHRAPPPTAAAVTQQQKQPQGSAAQGEVDRLDIPDDSAADGGTGDQGLYARPLHWRYGECVNRTMVAIPTFKRVPAETSASPSGSSSSSSSSGGGSTLVEYALQPAPVLTRPIIQRVKVAALRALPKRQKALAVRLRARGMARGGKRAATSGLVHPGGYAGTHEVALMQRRLADGDLLAVAARDSLLTGKWVPRNIKDGSGWYPPTDAPPHGYGGPYAMESVQIEIGGTVANTSACPPNYPKRASAPHCAHVAFVELDGSMAYKYALAYAATGDARYAKLAAGAVRAWARTNRAFGRAAANGPLEAAWGCASMARAVELLRGAWDGLDPADVGAFVSWAYAKLLPNVDFFADVLSAHPPGMDARRLNFGNWHASAADCMVALGVLADDRPRYERGLALYRTTVRSYLKWGTPGYERDAAGAPRLRGEATETLRDVYHTLFGLGSLIQSAEAAWHQGEDVYSESGHALAAALELHARLINARLDGDAGALPAGFRWFEAMPKAPPGCAWRWDVVSQGWSARNVTPAGGGAICAGFSGGLGGAGASNSSTAGNNATTGNATTGSGGSGPAMTPVKYLLGVKYLPNGFELGYNHYAGRLGLKLPEVAKLLSRYPVDWHEFCWGLATLTHAESAATLWRPGVRPVALCEPSPPAPEPTAGGAGGLGGGTLSRLPPLLLLLQQQQPEPPPRARRPHRRRPQQPAPGGDDADDGQKQQLSLGGKKDDHPFSLWSQLLGRR